MSNYYGLKPMSFEEEINAPENIKRIRQAKMSMVDRIATMRQLLEQIERTAKGAVECDNDEQVKRVEELYAFVSGATADLELALNAIYNH